MCVVKFDEIVAMNPNVQIAPFTRTTQDDFLHNEEKEGQL